jgi:hypothetical protein
MHWIIQENLFHESGMEELLRVVKAMDLPHTLVKVVPFVGEIIPDVSPEGKVICIGSYSMRNIAKKKGWKPGVYDIGFEADDIFRHWRGRCLNDDRIITPFKKVPHWIKKKGLEDRPMDDSKAFAGTLMDAKEFKEWHHKVCHLNEDDGSTLTGDTLCIIAAPKTIHAEYRVWIVNGFPVTASQYKRGDRVRYDGVIDDGVIPFVKTLQMIWQPKPAYVMDVALIDDAFKVVEINTINAAGLYAANVGKLVEALERLER